MRDYFVKKEFVSCPNFISVMNMTENYYSESDDAERLLKNKKKSASNHENKGKSKTGKK
jgi:hypothetical protein